MRKTKIVATIGPASSDPAVFAAMCKAGVNVARLNFSHGTHEEQLAKIHMIKTVREELDLPIAIMLDTKGPEYRTGTFKNGKVHINDGDLFTFTTRRRRRRRATIVSVSYKNLAKELRAGDTILVNNGLVSFRVLECGGHGNPLSGDHRRRPVRPQEHELSQQGPQADLLERAGQEGSASGH